MMLSGFLTVEKLAHRALALALLVAANTVSSSAQVDGSPKWPSAFRAQGYFASSPAISNDGQTIYIGVSVRTTPALGRLYAIDASGALKWQSVQLNDWVDSSPAIGPDGTIYVGCWDGKLYAFEDKGRTSEQVRARWQYDTGVAIGMASPAVARDGTIYVGAWDSALHAITPAGARLWRHAVGGFVDTSPAIGRDGTVYFGSWDKNIYAVNPDGSEKWHVTTGAEVLSSAAIGTDGTIYVGSSDRRLYAISPEGATRWTYLTEGEIQASPVIGPDETIYFGSLDKRFYAIKADGTLRWTGPSGKAIISTAVVRGDGAIIYGSDDGKVRAVNPADATVKWAFQAQDIVESSPVIAPDGTLYVAQLDGALYALNGNGSPLSRYSSWPMRGRDPGHTGAKPLPASGGQLLNLATRAPVGVGSSLIAGVVIAGSAPKNYLFRGIGPTLAQFFVPNPLPDPVMQIYSGRAVIAERDDWGSAGDEVEVRQTAAAVGAFALPDGSKDAAMVTTLAPGLYTAVISSADAGSGIALVEAYDAVASSGAARLVNLSTRGRVTSGGGVIPGLFIGGTGPLRVLVRAVGPTLAAFGVEGVLARPTMSLFSDQTLLQSNTGWVSGGLKADLAAAMAAVGAFPLPDSSADCAMLVTLNPGAYTIPVAGVNNTAGEVLIEVYVVP
ncbi:MAG: PQQ-like beta-propeller repeat protein [Verrucomicrobia bacterium]|nr:PQQ-like beta-propeller repeat protein [Verrucomicrobiota bacterium]